MLFGQEFFRMKKLWLNHLTFTILGLAAYAVMLFVLNSVVDDVSLNRTGNRLKESQSLSLLIGFVMWWVGLRIMPTMASIIRQDINLGTFEQILLGGNALLRYFLATIAKTLLHVLEGGVLFIVMMFIQPSPTVSFELSDSLEVVTIVLTSLVGVVGIMLFFAGLSFVSSSAFRIASLFGQLSLFLGQLISFNGVWGVLVNTFLPMTKGTSMIRKLVILEGQALLMDYMFLSMQSLVFLILGMFTFSYYFKKVNSEGGFLVIA